MILPLARLRLCLTKKVHYGLNAFIMDEKKLWQVKNKTHVYNARIFDIFNLDCYLPSKNLEHDFFSLEMPGWINVFAITADGKVILVKQHRIGKNQVTVETPAGGINPGEEPEVAAKRELEEETGYSPGELILLKKIAVNPAIQNNNCYIFIALDCKKTMETSFDLGEEIELVIKEKEEVFDLLDSDFFDNSLAFLSILLARDFLSKNEK